MKGSSNNDLYFELELKLPSSNSEKRKTWVRTIVEKKILLKDLASLLKADYKIASRFMWLISEIGLENPKKLYRELPFLLEYSSEIEPAYLSSFANWWLIAGLPPENEARAIDLCFQWLLSPAENVTIKSRAIWVLQKLTRKYPELKNELKICLQEQLDKYSKDYDKRIRKVLLEL